MIVWSCESTAAALQVVEPPESIVDALTAGFVVNSTLCTGRMVRGVNVAVPVPPVTVPLSPIFSVVTLDGAVKAILSTISSVESLFTVQVIDIFRSDEFHSAKKRLLTLDPGVIHARLLPEAVVSIVISDGMVTYSVTDVTPDALLTTIGGV